MQHPVRRLGALLLAVAATAVPAAPASAAGTGCDTREVSQPFKRWLDPFYYVQAPNGDFEAGLSGWSARGGAVSVAGNESWHVAGVADAKSVKLPAGASITSPSFCAGLTYPTVRLFSKGGGGLLSLATLQVEVLYTDNAGLLRSTGLGLALSSSGWQPSLPMLTLSGLPLLTGSQLALRITARGGTFYVDDVFIDPYNRH
jgi:hypothetical protein